jgi:hypothetical protein
MQEIHMPVSCTEATANPKPYFLQWAEGVHEGSTKAGFDPSVSKRLPELLHNAGFTNIQVQWQNWPVGPWPKGAKNKRMGQWWAEDMKRGPRSTGAMFTRLLGWTQEAFHGLIDKVEQEITEQKKHMWVEMWVL